MLKSASRGGLCLVRGGGVCSQGGLPGPGGVFPSGDPPPVNRMTNRCKNITLATIAAGKNRNEAGDSWNTQLRNPYGTFLKLRFRFFSWYRTEAAATVSFFQRWRTAKFEWRKLQFFMSYCKLTVCVWLDINLSVTDCLCSDTNRTRYSLVWLYAH